MAQWVCFQNRRQNLSIFYRVPGQPAYDCGEVRSDTPERMILEWLLENGTYNAGDLIRFPSRPLQCLPPLAEDGVPIPQFTPPDPQVEVPVARA